MCLVDKDCSLLFLLYGHLGWISFLTDGFLILGGKEQKLVIFFSPLFFILKHTGGKMHQKT